MSYEKKQVAHHCNETIIYCDNPECASGFILTVYREWEDDDYGPQVNTFPQCFCAFCPYCGKKIEPINLDKEKEDVNKSSGSH